MWVHPLCRSTDAFKWIYLVFQSRKFFNPDNNTSKLALRKFGNLIRKTAIYISAPQEKPAYLLQVFCSLFSDLTSNVSESQKPQWQLGWNYHKNLSFRGFLTLQLHVAFFAQNCWRWTEKRLLKASYIPGYFPKASSTHCFYLPIGDAKRPSGNSHNSTNMTQKSRVNTVHPIQSKQMQKSSLVTWTGRQGDSVWKSTHHISDSWPVLGMVPGTFTCNLGTTHSHPRNIICIL